jgi:hypothetical protein
MPSPTEGYACAPTTVATPTHRGDAHQGIVQSPDPSVCALDITTGAAALQGLRQFAQPPLDPVRTCRTGRRSGTRATPSLSHEVPAEASAVLSELVGSHQSPLPYLFHHYPRTEAPSLHRHYPASTVLRASRRPNRPGLALAGCRFACTSRLRLGFPVLRRSPLYMHAVATTPAEPLGAHSLASPATAAFPAD